MGKTFVEVFARHDREGNVRPEAIVWEDGRLFEVDSILDVRPAASLKAGGRGIRYTCRILGHRRYLFYDDPQWFVES